MQESSRIHNKGTPHLPLLKTSTSATSVVVAEVKAAQDSARIKATTIMNRILLPASNKGAGQNQMGRQEIETQDVKRMMRATIQAEINMEDTLSMKMIKIEEDITRKLK